jgi:hypothetical protein
MLMEAAHTLTDSGPQLTLDLETEPSTEDEG